MSANTETDGETEETSAENKDEAGSMWGPWLLAGGAAAIGAGAVGVTVGKKLLRRVRNRRRANED